MPTQVRKASGVAKRRVSRRKKVYRKKTTKVDVALSKAVEALKIAKGNEMAIEVKKHYTTSAGTSFNFATGHFAWHLDDMAAGTGTNQVNGTTAQMLNYSIRLALQNTRTGCPDVVRMMLVQYPTETVLGSTPAAPPLDLTNLPAAIHGGVDYINARLQPFSEDPAVGATVLRYRILADRVIKLASIDEGASSLVEIDLSHQPKGKYAILHRDPGAITTHQKNNLVLWVLGGDINRAAGVSSVDYKLIAQTKYRDA